MKSRSLSRTIAGIYCCLFACVHVLLFHDKFFDINRTKYYALLWSAGPALGISFLLYLFEKKSKPDLKACAGLIVLLLSASVGTILAADPNAALTGSSGRYMGLLTYAGCGALFVMYLHSRFPSRCLTRSLLIGADLCAILGILNFFRIDPFDFYSQLTREVYRNDFISTIGNINFFSAYLCLAAGISAGLYMTEKKLKPLYLISFALSVSGILAARTESAFIGLFFMTAVIVLRADEYKTLFTLAAVGTLSAAAMGFLAATAPEHMEIYEGIAGTILNMPRVMLCIGIVCVAAAVLLRKHSVHKVVRIGIPAMMLAFLIACLGALVWFSRFDTETAVPSLLRMSDTWGTFRGFIWDRCLTFYSEAPFLQKLFGTGPDTVRAIFLENFSEDMYALMGIQVDNAHNELLQLLVTTGIVGLAGYIALYLTAFKRARHDLPLLLALTAHIAQSFFNIAQPETTPVVFLLLAAACLTKKEITNNEQDLTRDNR